jgi:hypothetical protein
MYINMNKIYRIVQYIQPWEIDDIERQINQLIKSSYYIENSKNVILDIVLNLKVVDWDNSKIDCEFFIKKFKYLQTKASNYFTTEFNINTCDGVTAARRNILNKKHDYIIWLDSDVFFPIQALPYLISATKEIKDVDYILSPQLIRYWDSSWDCLTADQFLSQPFNHRDFFDVYSLDSIVDGNIYIKKNDKIKFGGGWFNLFTNSLFQKIGIPEEIGAYGPDDTFISQCSMYLKIPQYILSGIIVTEIGNKFLQDKDYIKNLLHINILDKEKITDFELYKLIHNFINTH